MGRDIDEIIKRVRELLPNVIIEQLHVSHPGVDDDGLWFFKLPNNDQRDIQIESSCGQCPFILEHNEMRGISDRWTAKSVDEAVEKIVGYLET